MFGCFDNSPECDDPLVDYTEGDREIAEKWAWLSDALPWVTGREMDVLRKREDFPGIESSYTDLSAFVDSFAAGKRRIVPCKVAKSGGTLSATLDVISGQMYLLNDGQYEASTLDGAVTVSVVVDGKALQCLFDVAMQGKVEQISARDVKCVVEALAASNSLPPL